MSERPATTAYPMGLRHVTERNRRLRELVAKGLVMAPGCFDCLSARLVETSGFQAAYITGSGVSISQLGAPDVGLASFSEIFDRMKRIADVVSIPLIADLDTGFGGPLNVIRAVREMERAGLSALQLEDQEAPKKCGHEMGRRLVTPAEMVGRIKAAVDARVDPDLMIVARTDARTSEGLAAALDRAEAYREAGADILFVESPESTDEMRTICARFAGRAPTLANLVEGGRTPILPARELAAIGYGVAIYPNSLTRAFAHAGQEIMRTLKETGTTAGFADRMLDHRQLWSLFDYDTWLKLEADFGAERTSR